MMVAELIDLLTDCPLGAKVAVSISENEDDMICADIKEVGIGKNYEGKDLVVLQPKHDIQIISDN